MSCEGTRWHEAAHWVAANALGLPVLRVSVAAAAPRVDLEPMNPRAVTDDLLRRHAVATAAGPAADARFDSRGWRGYRLGSSRNDLNKLARLAVWSRAFAHPFTAREALAEAHELLAQLSPHMERAVCHLAQQETIEGPLLARLSIECGGRMARIGLGLEAARGVA